MEGDKEILADAKRYRWLREQFAQGYETYIGQSIMTERELDELIDMKMAKEA